MRKLRRVMFLKLARFMRGEKNIVPCIISAGTKITGNITDATGLFIDPKGNINGIIIGDMGKARLNTVYAGGYNDDIIVNERHGQVLHFRTLVHKVK